MAHKLYQGNPDDRCSQRGGKLCKNVCPSCKHQRQFAGRDPQTGEPMAKWECEFTMQTDILIQLTMFQFQTGAAIESFRNETVDQNRGLINGAAILAHQTLEGLAKAVPQLESPKDD